RPVLRRLHAPSRPHRAPRARRHQAGGHRPPPALGSEEEACRRLRSCPSGQIAHVERAWEREMAMALAGTFLIGATGYVHFVPADLVLLAAGMALVGRWLVSVLGPSARGRLRAKVDPEHEHPV